MIGVVQSRSGSRGGLLRIGHQAGIRTALTRQRPVKRYLILRATSLSSLGLGAQPPTPEWGAMIDEGREFLRRALWGSMAPSAVMMLAVLSLNLVGDALRDVMAPYTDAH